MEKLIILVCVLAFCGTFTTITANQECYSATNDFCDKKVENQKFSTLVQKCNSKYSGIDHVVPSLQDYVFQHIIHSYNYLKMAVNFASYKRNRAGFEKFFKHLSDDTWEDTIELIKYITKRGHKMDFAHEARDCKDNEGGITYCTNDLDTLKDLDEIQSMSKALDMHKSLAHNAHNIHSFAAKRSDKHHDPEVSSYIENEFVHKHAKTVRTLSGHLNDLVDMVHDADNNEGNLAVYLFDEYLSKSI